MHGAHSKNGVLMTTNGHKKQKAPRMATLDDLTARNLDITLQIGEDEDGEPIEVQFYLKELSFFKIQQLRNSVPNPVPPVGDIQKDDNGIIKRLPNYDDPTYRQEVEMKEHERTHRIIFAAWRQDKLPIPGETDDDKLNWIKENLNASIIRQIIDVLATLAMKGSARIEARADTFQPG